MVFRNETVATEKRARKAKRKAIAQKLGKEPELEEEEEEETIPIYSPASSKDQSILATLNLPIEEQASCHFVSNYVLIPRQGSTRGYMEFVLPLMKENARAQHFKYAFDACALASLGNRVGPGNDFEKQALGKYTKALAATHHALKDPTMAKTDATLASVLLLGLFENITAKQLGMLAWGSHTEGAINIVKERGREQLKTKSGLILFIAVRTQMVSSH